MGTFLEDGTCVPDHMPLESMGVLKSSGALRNFALREGEVKEIIYPQDKRSQSKQYTEYLVQVKHSEPGGGSCHTKYTGVMISVLFGGIADFFRYTLRADDGTGDSDKYGVGVGSKVTLLCSNGMSSSALILGGVRDKKNDPDTVDKESDGHHLDFAFNGISTTINKDGEFRFQFIGKTLVNGKIDEKGGAKKEASGTSIAVTKDGSFEIFTKDRNQYWKIDHENHKTFMVADQLYDIQVEGQQTSRVKKEVDWTFGSTWTIAAKKDTSIDVEEGKLDIHAANKVTIKSAGVEIGGASDSFPLFSTYRDAEKSLHDTMKNSLLQAVIALQAAATAMKVPITGAVAGGVLIGQAATALQDMLMAITQFEAKSSTFVSKYNKND